MNTLMRGLRLIEIVLAVTTFWLVGLPLVAHGQEEAYGQLDAMGNLSGDAYVRERDRLLKAHPGEWSVKEASAVSWRAGLAAYLLNDRLREPKQYEKMDRQEPSLNAKMRSFKYSTLAFLLEKMWKAEQAQFEAAYQDIRQGCYGERGTIDLPVEICLAIWAGDANNPLKEVALLGLATHDTPAAKEVIRTVLLRTDFSSDQKKTVLYGVRNARARHASPIIIESVPLLLTENAKIFAHPVFDTLAVLPDEAARQALYHVVTDTSMPFELRMKALEACAREPKPGDIEVFRRLFADEREPGRRGSLAMKLGGYPHRLAAPLMRELLQNRTEPESVLEWIMWSLDKMYAREKIIPASELQADQAALSSIVDDGARPQRIRKEASRIRSALANRVQFWEKRATKPSTSTSSPSR